MDPGNIGVASFATIQIVPSISCRFAIHFFLSSLFDITTIVTS